MAINMVERTKKIRSIYNLAPDIRTQTQFRSMHPKINGHCFKIALVGAIFSSERARIRLPTQRNRTKLMMNDPNFQIEPIVQNA